MALDAGCTDLMKYSDFDDEQIVSADDTWKCVYTFPVLLRATQDILLITTDLFGFWGNIDYIDRWFIRFSKYVQKVSRSWFYFIVMFKDHKSWQTLFKNCLFSKSTNKINAQSLRLCGKKKDNLITIPFYRRFIIVTFRLIITIEEMKTNISIVDQHHRSY